MFVTVEKFCELTGLGQDFVRQLCRTPGFPVIMNGRKYMIDRDGAIQYLKEKATYREYVKIRNRRTA